MSAILFRGQAPNAPKLHDIFPATQPNSIFQLANRATPAAMHCGAGEYIEILSLGEFSQTSYNGTVRENLGTFLYPTFKPRLLGAYQRRTTQRWEGGIRVGGPAPKLITTDHISIATVGSDSGLVVEECVFNSALGQAWDYYCREGRPVDIDMLHLITTSIALCCGFSGQGTVFSDPERARAQNDDPYRVDPRAAHNYLMDTEKLGSLA